MRNSPNKGILYAGVTALMWGFLAVALKLAVNEIDPVTVSWFRFTVAFCLLSIILAIKRPKSFSILRRPPLLAIFAGLCLGMNYIGYIKGIHLTSPSNAQVIMQIAPIILAIVGVIVFKERLNRRQVLGFTIAITGFGLFYRDQISGLVAQMTDRYSLGVTWVLFGAVMWATFASIQKHLVKSYNPQSLNLIMYAVPSLALLPFIDHSAIFEMSLAMWALVLFLGANTLLAYGALAEAFKYAEANKVGIVITLNPILTIGIMSLLAFFEVSWIQYEHITWLGFIGVICVIIGVIMAVGRNK